MSNKRSNILHDYKQGDNIFDKYFTFLEKQKINSVDSPSLAKLGVSITIIERNLIDISQNKKAGKFLIERLNYDIQEVLNEWYISLTQFSTNETFVSSLAYNLFGLSLVANETNWTDEIGLKTILSFFAPSKDYTTVDYKDTYSSRYNSTRLEFQHQSPSTLATSMNVIWDNVTKLRLLSQASNKIHNLTQNLNFKLQHRTDAKMFSISVSELIFENIEILRTKTQSLNIWEIIHNYQLTVFEDANAEWSINIKINEDEPEAVNFFELLHHFTLALKIIDDEIEVKLEDWGNGSKWALLRVTIKSFFSREDVKSILEKAFQSADAQLVRKPIAEADKIEAEAKRISKETANLKTEMQAFEAEELDLQMKRISVVKSALEAEEQLINNKLKALQAANQISEMIKNGIVKNNSSLEIEINGLLAYKSGELIKTKMEEIANREALKPKLKDPDTKA